MSFRAWFTFSMFLLVQFTFAQSPPPTAIFESKYENYTVEDDLPSNETYHIMQDSKGYIWIASDQGVTRYDGTNFENFGLEDGMSDEVVFKFYEDALGRVWMVSNNRRLCYFADESFHNYQFNDTITKYTRNANTCLGLYVDSMDNVNLGYFRGGFLHIDGAGLATLEQGSSSRVDPASKEGQCGGIIKHFVGGSTCVSYWTSFAPADFGSQPKRENGRHYTYVSYDENGKADTIQELIADADPQRYKSVQSVLYSDVISKDSVVCVTSESSWLIMTADTIITMHEDYGITYLQHIDGCIWVSLRNNGVKKYRLNDLQAPPIQFLNGLTVSSVEIDRQGGLWASTLEKGVFFFINPQIKTYSPPEFCSNITAFHLHSKGFYLFYTNGWIQRNSEGINAWQSLPFEGLDVTTSVDETKDDFLVYGANLHSFSDGKLVSEKNDLIISTIKQFVRMPNGELYGCSPYTLLVASDVDTIVHDMRPLAAYGMTRCDTALILATDAGYKIWKNNATQDWKVGDESWPAAFKSFLFFEDRAFIYTKTGELFEQFGSKVKHIFTLNPALSDVRTLCVHKQTFYLGTKTGVRIYNESTGEQSLYSVKDGLPDPSVRALTIFEDTLWVATQTGLSKIALNRVSSPTAPAVLLSFFNINETAVSIADTFITPFQKNRIEIGLKVLNFKHASEPIIAYQLIGEDPNPLTTIATQIRYSSLNPGTYTFAYRVTIDGVNYSPMQRYTLIVLPPYWQTWWFISLMAFVLIMPGFLLLRWRVRFKLNKSKITQQLLELRSSALRAQMNPHFTYNALNSIQSLIASDQTEEATVYLAEFSSLMRQALQASSQEMISLKDEIKIVTHYLLLEKLRFKTKIEYDVQVDSGLSLESILVPPMIIQPYVENAIIHGLLPKQMPGNVKIKIRKKEANQLLIVIEDDGIGLAKSAESYIPGATSKGMEITKSRVQLLDERNQLEVADTEGGGTTIMIKLHVEL
jgi:ligand-binding sensor domain-containing protein/two-component sensor histidine kinase